MKRILTPVTPARYDSPTIQQETTTMETILTKEQVTDEILGHVHDIVDGYYLESPIDRFDFIDRVESWAEVDLGDQIDSPAIEYLIRKARAYKRESIG
jgi:hypothetical protein